MISITLILFSCFLNSFSLCDVITLRTSPPPQDSCSNTLAVCKLDSNTLNASFKPGPSGPQGPKGVKGDMGSKGLRGSNGLNGPNGATGLPGPIGDPGIDGSPGNNGLMGLRGDAGPKGETGIRGKRGDIGLPGLQGFKGAQGTPGISGSCIDCPTEILSFSDADDWGTPLNPATTTCRDAPEYERDKESGLYSLFMENMDVFCHFTTGMTCINTLKSETDIEETHYNDINPFWLSEKISIISLYDLQYDQVSWLQQESYKANQTIRYHCLNSKPIGGDDNNLVLLTWNDLTIGPQPTAKTSFYYTVVYDGCLTAKEDVWSYSDIELVSPIAQRLPIIDFLIKDVGKENQALKIEIKELCFG